MSIDAKSLLVLIHENFIGTPYPGDDRIILDTSGVHLESEEIKHALKGHHWCELSFDTLDHLRSALFFLSPSGYRYYLPAFMFYSVADFERADVIPDEIIQTLIFPTQFDITRIKDLVNRLPKSQPLTSDEWVLIVQTIANTYTSGSAERLFLDRVSGFSIAQCKVIRQFLEYMRDIYGDEYPNQEPQIAIDRFWYQF